MPKSPWYRDGLRFECTGCGDCCSGAPGFVWVSEQEIAALAAELQMPLEQFRGQFVRQVDDEQSLVERPGGDCIFLDPQSRKCTVYGARPVQCRTWPFWDSTIGRKKDWEATCRDCPGSGSGRLYSFEEIEIQRKARVL